MSEDTEKIELECPICKHKQLVNLDTYMMFLFMGGHPYTCPTETCPSHTELIPTNQCLKEIRNLQIQNEKK